MAAIMVLVDQFFWNIPVGILFCIFAFSFLFSFCINFVKVRDEYEANKEALKLLYRYSDIIFLNHNDPRNWKSISAEAKRQLKEGLRKYKSSKYLIHFVSLSPMLLYLILLLIKALFS
ncbi:hypothetical protein [Parageobacillus thermantarcticus]|uniref:hypothetical protein n=1 Tax=Parageobacillus thermantarcticus TaxID=186116 RepID=UPI000B83A905|nr:hypothetical protein [Parageobacillus thermantarcticus]